MNFVREASFFEMNILALPNSLMNEKSESDKLMRRSQKENWPFEAKKARSHEAKETSLAKQARPLRLSSLANQRRPATNYFPDSNKNRNLKKLLL